LVSNWFLDNMFQHFVILQHIFGKHFYSFSLSLLGIICWHSAAQNIYLQTEEVSPPPPCELILIWNRRGWETLLEKFLSKEEAGGSLLSLLFKVNVLQHKLSTQFLTVPWVIIGLIMWNFWQWIGGLMPTGLLEFS
jgi:hypothetical protein